MYHRWITELQGYLPYRIESRPGMQHRNADGMSHARKDCTFKKCVACHIHHHKNKKAWDSNSDNSNSPIVMMSLHEGYVTRPGTEYVFTDSDEENRLDEEEEIQIAKITTCGIQNW